MKKIVRTGFGLFVCVSVFLAAAFSALPEARNVQTYDQLLQAVRETRAASQARIEAAVHEEKVREAWEIGKLIQEHILLNQKRAEYGQQVLKRLSGDLGMSESELGFMVQFAKAYPISWPARKLSWSHYQSLLAINDPKERDEVAKEAEEKDWSRDQVREEVRRRKHRIESPLELPLITPGPLNTYQIVRLKDGLKVDLGFGVYHDLPQGKIKFSAEGGSASGGKEGNIVQGEKGEGLVPATQSAALSNANLFTYSALVTQVVDGDTFHALIDLGFGVTLAQRVRLQRIDAPEILSAEGKEARGYLDKILFRDKGRIILQSRELDQHGRPLADVWVKGKPIDQEILDQGLAVRIRE